MSKVSRNTKIIRDFRGIRSVRELMHTIDIMLISKDRIKGAIKTLF
jgi:hypothetical protein